MQSPYAQQIGCTCPNDESGSRQEVACCSGGLSRVSSAHRDRFSRLQPKAAKPPADADLNRVEFWKPCWCRYGAAIQL